MNNEEKVENKNIKKIRSAKKSSLQKKEYNYSQVVEIYDSIIKCSVVHNVSIYDTIYDENENCVGYVDKISDIYIEVVSTISTEKFFIGQKLLMNSETISLFLYENLFNVVIDVFGNVLMSKNELDKNNKRIRLAIKESAPGIETRKTLNEQLLTGINAIDFLYPIGHGQRMLLVGDRKSYKTNTIVEIIKNEYYNSSIIKNHQPTLFIYVSVGQTKSKLVRFISNIFENTETEVIILAATSSSTLGEQILAPDAAMSIANHYALNNYKVCVFIDDLSKQAISIRENALIAKRLPGRESYPSNIFYAHSSLLERALNYQSAGSICCIPVIECLDGDVTGYVSTNLISITDGQIFNDKNLMNQLLVPPVSTELSVSRTGSSVQSNAFKSCSGKYKKTLAIYNKNLDFYLMYKESCDEQVKVKIKNGLFLKTFIYNLLGIKMHFINQIICLAILDNGELILSKYSLKEIEENKHHEILMQLFSNIYQQITENSKIVNKISINNTPQHVLEIIGNITKTNIEQILEKTFA